LEPGAPRVKVNERADSDAKKSMKEDRDNQILLPVADLEAQWMKKDRSPCFCQTKMNHHVLVSINCMAAGHSISKASLSRFNIVNTAECKFGDGLQMEEHVFLDCKLYKIQRAIILGY
jgi:hypothetical protein